MLIGIETLKLRMSNSQLKVLNTIVRCMDHYNPFDNLQSSGDDSITVDTGNNPGDVKASPASEFVPREDWVKFVDYCNSEKFLVYVYVICTYPCATSKRNKENQAKLIMSCTLGRTSMPITRHKLAEERGITDEEIGRVEVYIPAHTIKDKTIQCPDVIAELQNTMQKDPKNIQTGPNDVISQKFGKERKGGTRAMGAGMSISLVEKVGHIINVNEELRSTNNELKFVTEKLRIDLDELAKYVGNILVISPTDSLPSQQATSSSQREQVKHQHIDKEYRLVGCPWRIVAHGVIIGVDPTGMYHSIALGDDFNKVSIHDIVDGNALLFRPNSNIKRLLDVGIRSFVAWPKSMITF
ncbi:hypothetical protein GIB67_025483 [Kingdonia uniflora]|uniref:DUF8039 domain-containing protein n=1 Tax=Kingdonia uniflora TaxID=39325 RepID=A0A7J7PCK6_9MAGN|nr:hypothetical protein GIB67_025483 [Kingdonia uniflora]